jgi:hypothetical protein
MSLYNQIVELLPELIDSNEFLDGGSINLRNDADGHGDYIEKWEYTKPIPKGLKLGK